MKPKSNARKKGCSATFQAIDMRHEIRDKEREDQNAKTQALTRRSETRRHREERTQDTECHTTGHSPDCDGTMNTTRQEREPRQGYEQRDMQQQAWPGNTAAPPWSACDPVDSPTLAAFLIIQTRRTPGQHAQSSVQCIHTIGGGCSAASTP